MSEPKTASPPPEPSTGSRPITLNVDYTRLNSFFADYARNISKGGTFIKTDKALPVGTRFIFVLGFPDLPFPLPLTKTKEEHAPQDPRRLPLLGVVRSIVRPSQATANSPAGMGIEFLFDDENEKASVHGFVAALMEHELGPQLSRRFLVGR
jgi:type IV pilus assembly protein PilZ